MFGNRSIYECKMSELIEIGILAGRSRCALIPRPVGRKLTTWELAALEAGDHLNPAQLRRIARLYAVIKR